MPLQPCALAPFVGTQQFEVPITTSLLPLRRIAGTSWTLIITARPSAPIYGLTFNSATGAYDFVPSTKGNEQTLIDLAIDCYNASVNYAKDQLDNAFFPAQYAPINPNQGANYGDYLYRKVSANVCLLSRYIEVYNKSAQFFRLHAAIGAFDIAIYKELQVQVDEVSKQVDKQMLIPPGAYTFYPGSKTYADLEAWLAADATFSALFCLELVTT